MEGKKKGGQGYVRLARGEGGGGLNIFIKEKFRRGQQFDRQVYFKRGPLTKMGKAVNLN